jgi:hypothetical protein
MSETEKPKDWRKVRQAESNADPIESDRVLRMAERRYKDEGEPDGFEVRLGHTEFDDDKGDDAYRIYYFSPVASGVCATALDVLRATPEEEPTANLRLLVPDLLK